MCFIPSIVGVIRDLVHVSELDERHSVFLAACLEARVNYVADKIVRYAVDLGLR